MVAIKIISIAALLAVVADRAFAIPISSSAYEPRDLAPRGSLFNEGAVAQFLIGYRKIFRASNGYHPHQAAAPALRDLEQELDERDIEERYPVDIEEREIELDERDIEELYARYLAAVEDSEE